MTLQDITNTISKRTHLPVFKRGIIIGLSMAKFNPTKISAMLDIPISTVRDVINLYYEHGLEAPPKHPGRPSACTERTNMAISRAIRAEPHLPITTQHQQFVAGGMQMSIATFRRRLRDLGFVSYPAFKKPALTDQHRQNRLRWCQDKVHWTIDQWKLVIWSDESRFTVRGNDGNFRVVCKEGERLLDKHIIETNKFGKGSIMFWGCFWFGGLGPLVTMTGKINQEAYVDCLSKKYLPWLQELSTETGKKFLFQEDGAPCHTGSYATWYKKQRCEVDSFDFWPAQSPDLNPIEHLWAYIAHKLRLKRANIGNVAQLDVAVREIWEGISPLILENLVSSMPARCQAVINAGGGHTKY